MTNKLFPLLVICICNTVHAGQLGSTQVWISNNHARLKVLA
ncbi:MAG: hypothetical protein WD894_07250 [Pirellulales bacterium]